MSRRTTALDGEIDEAVVEITVEAEGYEEHEEDEDEETGIGFWEEAGIALAEVGISRESSRPSMDRFWAFWDHNEKDEPLPSCYREQGTMLCGLFYPGLRGYQDPFASPEAYKGKRGLSDIMLEFVKEVRAEALSLPLEAYVVPQGQAGWGMLTLQDLGKRTAACDRYAAKLPRTLALLDELSSAGWLAPESGKILRQAPNTGLQPHIDGLNMVLCCHLGLVIPSGSAHGETSPLRPWIECGGVRKYWVEGGSLIFDQSFVHSTFNPTEEERIVLAVDLWHHDLSLEERAALGALFDFIDVWNLRFEGAYYGMHLPHGWFKM